MSPEQFEDMPKILLEKDDVETFQRIRGKSNKGASVAEKDEPEIAISSDRSPSWFAILSLLIVIIGAASYLFNLQYKSSLIDQARITDLERRLSATGAEMDQSAVALQVKVAELNEKTTQLWEQMDKLWASAWRRNQEEIKNLSAALNKQNSTLTKNISAAEADVKITETTVGLLQERINSQVTNIQQVTSTLEQAKTSNTEMQQQFSSLREKLMSTALANNHLTSRLDELEKRLKAAEKAALEMRSKATLSPPTTTPIGGD